MSEGPERGEVDVAAPESDDPAAWRAFWSQQGQPWRTEPEIPTARCDELAQARSVRPDVAHSMYPFGGMRLSRADVEWLLATHDGGRGPVVWSDPAARARDGLDLRGADLHDIDLSDLPLARLLGGLPEDAWRNASAEQLAAARLHLERAALAGAHLEGAILEGAHLEEAKLAGAHLEEANLSFALLDGAYLPEAHLEGASLVGASLAGANLNDAHLEGAVLRHAVLSGAELFAAHLEGAKLREAVLAGRQFSEAELTRLRRWRPDLPDTLPGAFLGAFLGGAFLDPATALDEAVLGAEDGGSASLADVRWGGANLAVVEWAPVRVLGDEDEAWRAARHYEKAKQDTARLPELRRELLEAFRVAVRANRQLAVALREQGLNEEADRYSYRAQKLNRELLWRQALWGVAESQRAGSRRLRIGQRAQKLGAYLFSGFLDILSGYGYRPGRSLAAYVLTLVLFSLVYFVLGRAAGTPLNWIAAIALSINSFHGRGFFPGTVTPGDPVTIAAAVEAIVGLIIELSFIATFTQRYFGR